MKTVDARGQACPKPLILTKQALKEMSPGDSVSVLIDNPVSFQNVERFLTDNGMSPQTTEQKGVFTVIVRKQAEPLAHPDAASYCSTCSTAQKPPIVVFAQDKMGRGSDELGKILMKAFVNTIRETSPLPSHLVFYNSGILLTVEGSPLIDSFNELERKGISLLVCGTCAEYFKKKEAVRVGTLSNMYSILETMTAAGHIIQP
ncbi:MAG: sulfurtransferase-like selenium metabolism protein YedF [Chitinispirillaceae bacterium]|nr:sulfurtransferase-like selenium metabolism protein YedF [Chitinispirillaceae bacterium]